MKYNTRSIVAVVSVVIFAELLYVAWLGLKGSGLFVRQKEHAATRVVKACSNASHRPTCYDREIPALMSKFSFEDVFAITKIVQSRDASYAYCHVLGHEVSALQTKKDPSKWKEVVARCPSGMCSNGCVHGAFQERFRTDVLDEQGIIAVKPDLTSVCEARDGWQPTGIEQATCYHALGHLFMYITGAQTSKALALCDELVRIHEKNDFRPVCYDGVFMQIYQPLEPEDKALIVGKEQTQETVSKFCDQFEDQQRVSCVSESWPLFFNELTQNPQFVRTFCGGLGDGLRDRCYNGIFYILVVQFQFNLDVLEGYCNKLDETLMGTCFANVATRLIETDWDNVKKAIDWCGRASLDNVKQTCYTALGASAAYTFPEDSSEFRMLCESLPVAQIGSCLQKELR